MFQQKIVAAVIPAFNEETQIHKVINSMPEFIDHIVIIDDASKDKTTPVVQSYADKNQRIHLITHGVNQGVGGAIASGYEWCRDNNVDIAVVMAGDGQMDPIDLPNIIKPVADDIVDYSKANRLASGQAYKKIPKIRYFGNSVLSLLTKIASGYWKISDSQTGYTAINKKALHTIDWQTMYKRYGQPNDLLVKLNVYNFRVKDVTTEPVYNVGEKSKLKVRRVMFTLSRLLVRLFFWRLKEKYFIRDFHPLILFYALSMFSFSLFLGFTGRLIYLYVQHGHTPEITLLITMFLLVTSFQSMFFAMWFDYESNKDLNK